MTNFQTKPQVNTGRQVEMDVLKGSFIFLIFIVHSFQLLGNAEALDSVAYKGIFSVGMFTGASLFLFFMGFGLAYSRKQETKALAFSGIKWIGYQFLSNACNMVLLLIPLAIYAITGILTPDMTLALKSLTPYIIFMLNIFFITGVIQLLMAFLRYVKLPLYGYLVVAFIVAGTSPFLAQLTSSNEILSALIKIAFAAGGTVSFAFWPYISFTAIGYFFACYFRTCEDKSIFYKKTFKITIPISVLYIIWVLIAHPGLTPTFEYLHLQYMYPDILKCIATTAIILSTAGIVYFVLQRVEKSEKYSKKVFAIIHFFSKHISKLYAVHIAVYFFIFALLRYATSGTTVCLILSVPVSVITILIVFYYVKYENKLFKK